MRTYYLKFSIAISLTEFANRFREEMGTSGAPVPKTTFHLEGEICVFTLHTTNPPNNIDKVFQIAAHRVDNKCEIALTKRAGHN